MTFTSIPFLIFLAIFLIVYALCPERFRIWLLPVAGLVFMFMNSVVGAVWALVLAAMNYMFGIFLKKTSRPKSLLGIAVTINVMFLAAFKIGGTVPTGLSFYTFAAIAYLVTIARGQIEAETNPLRYAAYAAFFPKYLMGPITRYEELAPQFAQPRYSISNLQVGLENFVVGFCMKIFIADKLAILWNELVKIGFENLSTPLAWLGIFSFSIQLYIDWQAYTLMAIGIARMIGFRLPQNFNYPYLARSIGDYYRRWHMTLTRWLKDFVYIPLGGNRRGLLRTVINILIVWLVTSLWHGVGWNFIFWGMSLGVLIVVEKLWVGKFLEKHKVLSHLWVLFFIPLTWCCFAITDSAELGKYFLRLFPLVKTTGVVVKGDFFRILGSFIVYLLLGILFCFPLPEKLIHALCTPSERKNGKFDLRSWISCAVLAILFWIAVYELKRSGNNPFMYLNF